LKNDFLDIPEPLLYNSKSIPLGSYTNNKAGGGVMAMVKEKRKFNFVLLAVLIAVIIIYALFYFKVF